MKPQIRLIELKRNLPTLLQKGMDTFKTEDEQYLYLYLTLAAISRQLTKVQGRYRDNEVSANLYCAGVARPASGKGVINYVQRQLHKVHMHFLEKSYKLEEMYKEELRAYNKEKRNIPNLPLPKRPPFQVVFIPANCTSAKLLEHLQHNQTNEIVPMLLIDSEIDTLVGSMESELANISSVLRKAFHGETISMSRKTENQYLEIRDCQLALALTGTPGQFIKLVNNRSDGLMSRFMMYMVDSAPTVTGIRRCDICPDIKKTFEEIASEYFRFWEFLQIEAFTVSLNDDQLEILEQYLTKKLQESIAIYSDDVAQIILRHGLMAFKICMVLTALRKFEYAESIDKMTCNEEDFLTSLNLVNTSIHHSLRFFEMLPDANVNRKSGHMQRFLESLPASFTRKVALEIGIKDFKGAESTVDRWLSGYVKGGKIIQTGSGQYQKA